MERRTWLERAGLWLAGIIAACTGADMLAPNGEDASGMDRIRNKTLLRADTLKTGRGKGHKTPTPPSGSPFLALTRQPGSSVQALVSYTGTNLPIVQLKDASGNNLALAGVTITRAANPSGTGGISSSPGVTDATGALAYTDFSMNMTTGNYTITFSADGYGPVTSGTVTVTPGVLDQAQSRATVPGGTAGSSRTCTVQAKDGVGNNLTAGGASCSATVTGANPKTITGTDNGNGTYTLSDTPANAGTDTFDIKLNGITIGGGPYASVVGSAPGGSGSYPNQFVGATVIIKHRAQQLPVSGSSVGFDAGITVGFSNKNSSFPLQLLSGQSPPVNGPNVLRTQFYAGLPGDTTPVTWRLWESAGGYYKKLYISFVFRVKSGLNDGKFGCGASNWKFWYIAYGFGDSAQDNDSFPAMPTPGSQQRVSTRRLNEFLSTADEINCGGSRLFVPNLDTSSWIQEGHWYQVENVMQLETTAIAGTGCTDTNNGEFHQWYKDLTAGGTTTKTTQYTNIKYLDTRHSFTRPFWRFSWAPVWGNNGGSKTDTDYIDIAEIYVSGIPA